MRHILSVFLIGFTLTTQATGTAQAGDISLEAMRQLPPADVVVIGEVHDNPIHHENQVVLVEGLKPTALVFEMLSPEQARRITPENRADQQALAVVLQWEKSGWPDFAMYYPIFAAAPKALIVGAALPRTDVRRAVKEGAAVVFGARALRYNLARPLPELERMEREEGQRLAHCNALPENIIPGMVEAQRLRDAAFAQAVIDTFNRLGGPVVMITGNGHSRRDWGVPAAISLAAPQLSVLSIGQLEQASEAQQPFDAYLVTTPMTRPDPCAAFN